MWLGGGPRILAEAGDVRATRLVHLELSDLLLGTVDRTLRGTHLPFRPLTQWFVDFSFYLVWVSEVTPHWRNGEEGARRLRS